MREEGNLDVRSILNAGDRRGAKVHRCVTIGKRIEVEELDDFAPVALAGLRDLPDTLASRAIIVRMRRRAADEPVDQFRHRLNAPQGEQVRASIELWARSLPDELPLPPMPDSVTGRAAECWEPLLMVPDHSITAPRPTPAPAPQAVAPPANLSGSINNASRQLGTAPVVGAERRMIAGPNSLGQINAKRRANGLPPLTPDQAVSLLINASP